MTNWILLALNENELSDLKDTQNPKRFTGCTFLCPLLINEGNYLGWESTHAAAAVPAEIVPLTLPQQLAAQSFPAETDQCGRDTGHVYCIISKNMKTNAVWHLIVVQAPLEPRTLASYWLWSYNVC